MTQACARTVLLAWMLVAPFSSQAHSDAGVSLPRASAARLSEEDDPPRPSKDAGPSAAQLADDRELSENLEMLQNLDAAKDFELLHELSKKE